MLVNRPTVSLNFDGKLYGILVLCIDEASHGRQLPFVVGINNDSTGYGCCVKQDVLVNVKGFEGNYTDVRIVWPVGVIGVTIESLNARDPTAYAAR